MPLGPLQGMVMAPRMVIHRRRTCEDDHEKTARFIYKGSFLLVVSHVDPMIQLLSHHSPMFINPFSPVLLHDYPTMPLYPSILSHSWPRFFNARHTHMPMDMRLGWAMERWLSRHMGLVEKYGIDGHSPKWRKTWESIQIGVYFQTIPYNHC